MAVTTVTISREMHARLTASPGKLSSNLKKAALAALDAGENPNPPAFSNGKELVRVALNANESNALQLALLKHKADSLPELIAGLANRHLRPQEIANKKGELSQDASRYIVKPRKEQLILAKAMDQAEIGKQILLAEAGTGVGKGLIAVAHALYLQRNKGYKRVIVAAPTIQVMRQLIIEYRKLDHGGVDCPFLALLGINEFVSEHELREFLKNAEANQIKIPNASEAEHWLKKSADTADKITGLTWQKASLSEAAPLFPINEVILKHYLREHLASLNDKGALAYENSIKSTNDYSLIFCTHAMLGRDIVLRRSSTKDFQLKWDIYQAKRKAAIGRGESIERYEILDNQARQQEPDTGILSEFDAVVIDEAHALETNFAETLSDSVSFHKTYMRLLSLCGDPIRKSFYTLYQRLVQIGRFCDRITIDQNPEARDTLRGMVKVLKQATRKVDKAHKAEIQSIEETLSSAINKSEYQGYTLSIDFSPVRRYPQLIVGRKSVAAELDYLWQKIKTGVLISATLYMPKAESDDPSFSVKELSLPRERIATMFPLIPQWITEPVTLHLPRKCYDSPEIRSYLQPPLKASGVDSRNEYFLEVASEIAKITSSISGGTLVLLTSYEASEAISQYLMKTPVFNRLIITTRDHNFGQLKNLYLSRADKKESPIWLALGKAWTGLDLSSDKAAKNDTTVECLIIPRVPFGSNRSLTHSTRVESQSHMNFQYETWQTMKMLKQGMGRLVRRRNVPPKKLYILDSRLNKMSEQQYMRYYHRLFSQYKNVMAYP